MARSLFRRVGVVALPVIALLILLGPAPSLLYNPNEAEGCTRCHEIRESFDNWTHSAHREIGCKSCHGGVLTMDLGFHTSNLRRLIKHIQGEAPSQVLLVRQVDIDRVTGRCAECHQQEYAAWRAGPHSVTYADIFLDEEHNTKRLLMDDCFRCHGMHFQGAIEDLVEPVATRGPWRLKDPEMGIKPVIPCLACHEIHRQGEPRPRHDRAAVKGTGDERVMPSSLALFDRRTQVHVPAAGMPVPRVFDGNNQLTVSPDQRQALCYQCHAPRANALAGSGDDRTGMGVHEGISCVACHQGHSMETIASCAACHPRYSNCGIDLEKMNGYFRDPASRFDIHTIKCSDCHPDGVPPRRNGLAMLAEE